MHCATNRSISTAIRPSPKTRTATSSTASSSPPTTASPAMPARPPVRRRTTCRRTSRSGRSATSKAVPGRRISGSTSPWPVTTATTRCASRAARPVPTPSSPNTARCCRIRTSASAAATAPGCARTTHRNWTRWPGTCPNATCAWIASKLGSSRPASQPVSPVRSTSASLKQNPRTVCRPRPVSPVSRRPPSPIPISASSRRNRCRVNSPARTACRCVTCAPPTIPSTAQRGRAREGEWRHLTWRPACSIDRRRATTAARAAGALPNSARARIRWWCSRSCRRRWSGRSRCCSWRRCSASSCSRR